MNLTKTSKADRRSLAVIAAGFGAYALAMPSAEASWTLLDNFDSYSAGQTTTATGGSWTSVDAATPNSNILSSDGGFALETRGGTGWRGAAKDITGTASIPIGSTGTVFFQMKALGTGTFDIMTGLSPQTSNIDTTDAWQDFAVMPFVSNPGGTLAYRMNNAGLTGGIIFNMATDVWYNIWLVVDNAVGVEDYSVYFSTGTDSGTFGGTATVYRNSFTNVDLNALGFMAGGGAATSLLVDNIYYSPGALTSNPIPEPSLALLGSLGALGLLRRRRP